MKTVKLTIDGRSAEVFEKALGITELLEKIEKLELRCDEGGDKE